MLEFANFINRTDLVDTILTTLLNPPNTPESIQEKMEIILMSLPLLRQKEKYLSELLMDPGSKTAIYAAFGFLMDSAQSIERDIHKVYIREKSQIASLLGRQLKELGKEVSEKSVHEMLLSRLYELFSIIGKAEITFVIKKSETVTNEENGGSDESDSESTDSGWTPKKRKFNRETVGRVHFDWVTRENVDNGDFLLGFCPGKDRIFKSVKSKAHITIKSDSAEHEFECDFNSTTKDEYDPEWTKNLTSLDSSFTSENDLTVSMKIEFLEMKYNCDCPVLPTTVTCDTCKPVKKKRTTKNHWW
jgi:hypothetical protein